MTDFETILFNRYRSQASVENLSDDDILLQVEKIKDLMKRLLHEKQYYIHIAWYQILKNFRTYDIKDMSHYLPVDLNIAKGSLEKMEIYLNSDHFNRQQAVGFFELTTPKSIEISNDKIVIQRLTCRLYSDAPSTIQHELDDLSFAMSTFSIHDFTNFASDMEMIDSALRKSSRIAKAYQDMDLKTHTKNEVKNSVNLIHGVMKRFILIIENILRDIDDTQSMVFEQIDEILLKDENGGLIDKD